MGKKESLEHCNFISAGINLCNFGSEVGGNIVYIQRVVFSIVQYKQFLSHREQVILGLKLADKLVHENQEYLLSSFCQFRCLIDSFVQTELLRVPDKPVCKLLRVLTGSQPAWYHLEQVQPVSMTMASDGRACHFQGYSSQKEKLPPRNIFLSVNHLEIIIIILQISKDLILQKISLSEMLHVCSAACTVVSRGDIASQKNAYCEQVC